MRGLKGEEIDLFANKAAAKRNRTSQQILKNVLLATEDGGPLYSGGVDFSVAPQCDRFTALFQARIATFGSEYAFPHRCKDPDCEKRFEWVEDLEKRPIKALPAESVQTFLNGNRFTTSVAAPDGSVLRVVFQLLTPKLEDKIKQVQSLAPKEKATASLAQRIVSVEGIDDGKAAVKAFLKDLDAGPLLDLLADMDEVDGGIDTIATVECPHCGYEEDVELPLGDEFWSPKRRRSSTRPTTE